MTKQELNKAIKKLFSDFRKWSSVDVADWDQCENLKKELHRLYHADETMESLSKENIMRLLVLNRRYRAIAFHHFGTGINEDKL